MSKKIFETSIVITGDETGVMRALKAISEGVDQYAAAQKSAEAAQNNSVNALSSVSQAHDQVATSIQNLDAGLHEQSRTLEQSAANWGEWGKNIATTVANVATDMTVNSTRATAELVIMSEALGMSSESMSAFAYAAKVQGLALGESIGLLKSVTEKVGEASQFDNSKSAKALKALNLDAAELAKMQPDLQVLKIGEALSNVGNEAEKAAIAKVFGKDLIRMQPLLEDSSNRYNKLTEEGRKLNKVMSETDNQKIADMATSLTRLNDAAQGQVNERLALFAPFVDGTAEFVIENIDELATVITGLAVVAGGRLVSSIAGSTKALVLKEVAAISAAKADHVAATAAEKLAQSEEKAANSALKRAKNRQAGALGTQSALNAVTEAELAAEAAKKKHIAASNKMNATGANFKKVATVMGRGLALFGGPIGLAAVAGITAISYALEYQKDKAEETASVLANVTAKANESTAEANTPEALQKSLADTRAELEALPASIESTRESMSNLKAMIDSGEYPVETLIVLGNSYNTLKESIEGAGAKTAQYKAEIDRLEQALEAQGIKTEGSAVQTKAQEASVLELTNSLKKKTAALGLDEKAQLLATLASNNATEEQVKEALAEQKTYEIKKKKIEQDEAAAAKKEQLAQQYKAMLQGYEEERVALEKGARAALEYNLIKAEYSPEQIVKLMDEYDATERVRAETKATKEATEAKKAQRAQFTDLIKGYAQQAIALKDGEEAAYRYELAQKGLEDGQINALVAARKYTQELEGTDAFNKRIGSFELSVDSIGDAWTRTGSAADKAIAGMTKTYQDFSEQSANSAKDEERIAKDKKENLAKFNKGLISQAKFNENEAKLDKKEAERKEISGKNQIALYNGLAGAMSSAFAEGSKEAAAFQTVQQGLALYDGIRAVIGAWSSAPFPANMPAVALTTASVASLLGQMGQSFSGGGGGGSVPSMSSEQIGFETAKTDNDSVTNRLDQQIELLEAIERNGSASALNVDLAATEYEGAILEWVEGVFDESKMGYVNATFDAGSSAWAAIEEHYKNLDIANPYEMRGDQIRINAEQYYQDPSSLIAVIQDISQMSRGDEFSYSGPFGQEIADEYGYGDDAHEAFRAAMRSSFTELQGYLNDWAVTSIESLTDLSDASESMKESFDAITGTTRYATEELDEAYAVFDRISGGDYAGYLEKNIDSIARAEGFLEQLTGTYDEHGNQLTNFQLLLSKDVGLFHDQADAVERFNAILGDTFEGGAEEALNFISNIDLVVESLQKTRELEDQILELTDSEAYLVMMRQRELDALTDSQKALQKQVWALEDQAEAQTALANIAGLIDDALSPLSAAEKTLVDANRAMVTLGMTGLTYKDALMSIEDYDTGDLISLADALGMSFEDIQTMIKDIIDGNEHISGGSGSGGVQSAEAAQTALSVAEVDVWQFADVINESFSGVIPTLDEFNAAFGDLGATKLASINNDFGGLIDKLGGLPNSINGLEAAYFSQLGDLELIDPVDPDDEIGFKIQNAYETYLGRLPDVDGLAGWLKEMDKEDNPLTIEGVVSSIQGSEEAAEYSQFLDLKAAFSAYQDILADAGFDIGAMQTALANYEVAELSLSIAKSNDANTNTSQNTPSEESAIDNTAVFQEIRNSALESTNPGAVDGLRINEALSQLDLSDLDFSGVSGKLEAFVGMTDQELSSFATELGLTAEEVASAVSIVATAHSENAAAFQAARDSASKFSDLGELGLSSHMSDALEQLELTDIALGDVSETLAMVAGATDQELSTLAEGLGLTAEEVANAVSVVANARSELDTFNDDIALQIQQFGLEGEAKELFDLELWYENLIEQAKKVGGDVDAVDELYDLKKEKITVDKLVEEAGLNTFLQSVSNYVDDQSQFIKDSFADQIAIVKQWQDVAKGLRDYVDQIRLSELSPAGPAEKLQQAHESFTTLLDDAKGGDIEAAGQLTGAADTYLNLADAYYGRSGVYTSEFDFVVDSLDELGVKWAAENDGDAIKRLNEQMRGELETLSQYARDELQYARQQAEKLTGIETALGAWPEKFDTMLDGLATDIGTTVTNAIPAAPDRPVVNAGGGSTTGNTGQPSGSGVDTGSAGTDTSPVSSGMSASDASDIIHASMNGGVNTADYQAAAATLGITSYADLADFINDGSHVNGLDRVPFDGYRAELHKNEMVLTADVSDHIRQSMKVASSVQADPVVSRVVDQLVRSNEQLAESNRQMAVELSELKEEQKRANQKAEQQRDGQEREIKSVARAGRKTPEVV